MGVHWKDWCWSWNSNTLATWCKELTHLKRPWCWERLRAGEEGDDRGWDGWMASPTQWTWVWVGSGSWWWTGRPGVLQFMQMQGVGHNWETELNWTEWEVHTKHLLPLPELWLLVLKKSICIITLGLCAEQAVFFMQYHFSLKENLTNYSGLYPWQVFFQK